MKTEKLRRIAIDEGISVQQFVNFMVLRFPQEQSEIYVKEWAERFKQGSMFMCADAESLAILKEVFGIR